MPVAITEEEIRSKLSISKVLAHKLWCAYQIYRKTPEQHRSLGVSGENFDEWLKSRMMELDQSKARASQVYSFLSSGLTTKEIRQIIVEAETGGSNIGGGLRVEESSILDEVDELVEKGTFLPNEIQKAMFDIMNPKYPHQGRVQMDIEAYYRESDTSKSDRTRREKDYKTLKEQSTDLTAL